MWWILPTFFIAQITALFFISRTNIRYIFFLLHSFTSNKNIVYTVIATIFLPGTIIHELSHFLGAMVLLLKVHEIHIFPQWDKGYIKLGRVVYEKKDVFRSILVGIAPIIVGLLFFWWLSAISVFSIHNIYIRIVAVYIIFVVSSTMFSSKQDLVDLIYIIPVIIFAGVILYFYPQAISFVAKQSVLIDGLQKFLYDVNKYLLISLIIHTGLIITLFILLRIFKKNI
jgi:hypothetical protein